jgi:hypothetical protein
MNATFVILIYHTLPLVLTFMLFAILYKKAASRKASIHEYKMNTRMPARVRLYLRLRTVQVFVSICGR